MYTAILLVNTPRNIEEIKIKTTNGGDTSLISEKPYKIYRNEDAKDTAINILSLSR
jgi:hypothetical protein